MQPPKGIVSSEKENADIIIIVKFKIKDIGESSEEFYFKTVNNNTWASCGKGTSRGLLRGMQSIDVSPTKENVLIDLYTTGPGTNIIDPEKYDFTIRKKVFIKWDQKQKHIVAKNLTLDIEIIKKPNISWMILGAALIISALFIIFKNRIFMFSAYLANLKEKQQCPR